MGEQSAEIRSFLRCVRGDDIGDVRGDVCGDKLGDIDDGDRIGDRRIGLR